VLECRSVGRISHVVNSLNFFIWALNQLNCDFLKQKGFFRRLSQSNLILEENTKKFENIQSQKTKTNIIQAQQMRYMANNVDGQWRFVVKVPNHNHPASPPEARPMRHLFSNFSCIQIFSSFKILVMYLAIFVVYLAKTPISIRLN